MLIMDSVIDNVTSALRFHNRSKYYTLRAAQDLAQDHHFPGSEGLRYVPLTILPLGDPAVCLLLICFLAVLLGRPG